MIVFFRKMASYYPNVRRQKSTGDNFVDVERKIHLRDKNPAKTSCGQAVDVHVGIMEHKVTLDNAVNEFIAE